MSQIISLASLALPSEKGMLSREGVYTTSVKRFGDRYLASSGCNFVCGVFPEFLGPLESGISLLHCYWGHREERSENQVVCVNAPSGQC